jgi:hypothetical protein
MPDETLLQIAHELQACSPGYWGTFQHTEALIGWRRHDGCCAYCGKDLMASWEDLFGATHTDHLLPRPERPTHGAHCVVERSVQLLVGHYASGGPD